MFPEEMFRRHRMACQKKTLYVVENIHRKGKKTAKTASHLKINSKKTKKK